MKQTLEVIYDGEVFRPQEPVDLAPNQRYRATIEPTTEEQPLSGMPRSIARILQRAEDLGVPDLAEQHDHYLYGTPKR